MPDRTGLAARALIGLGIGAAVVGLVVPASAAPQVAPRAGHYSGSEAVKPSPLPVTFVVSKNRRRVQAFAAEAQVKAGCTNHITEFQAPTGPMPISTAGRFSRSSRAYPQKGVQVTVTGHFTSPTTVSGHITIRLSTVKGCNASRPFSAQRTA